MVNFPEIAMQIFISSNEILDFYILCDLKMEYYAVDK